MDSSNPRGIAPKCVAVLRLAAVIESASNTWSGPKAEGLIKLEVPTTVSYLYVYHPEIPHWNFGYYSFFMLFTSHKIWMTKVDTIR